MTSSWKGIRGRFGLILWALLHLAVFSADFLAPFPPEYQDRAAASQAPGWEADDQGRRHFLGTDRFGRDVLSRLLHGTRLSLAAGLAAAFLAIFLGISLGLIAGYCGGWIDSLLMRLSELTLSLPWLYLLLGVRAVLPLETPPATSLFYLVALIGLLAWAKPARLVRGVAKAARHADYVTAARGFGASNFHLVFRHVLPQTLSTALTQFVLLIPACLLAEVVLSFFGLGAAENQPSLGSMLAAAQDLSAISLRPWLLSPVLALALLVLSYHQMSHALQWRDMGRT